MGSVPHRDSGAARSPARSWTTHNTKEHNHETHSEDPRNGGLDRGRVARSQACQQHLEGRHGGKLPTPANPEIQQRATLGKVLAFAAISGASAAVIQAVTKRWTGKLTDKG